MFLGILLACGVTKDSAEEKERILDDTFKSYWYQGGAELNVYDLHQARYGEYRKGQAVMVFVTEPFQSEKLVKADQSSPKNKQVLKLNYLKKFSTGVYDYSMMLSDFFPLKSGAHALKVTASSQEWCGHTFMQLENRKDFEIQLHSYFESEGEQDVKLKSLHLEDDVMNQIRVNPELLPQGDFEMLPSLFYMRLKHKEVKAYQANAELTSVSDTLQLYHLTYPREHRSLKVYFGKSFPHTIWSWEESYPESWTDDSNIMTSTATLTKQMRLPYWEHNKEKDSIYRRELGLPKL
ncbi:MAG: septum formation inhibitor Maf [Bacteroidetes bacterium]|nr:MAG: septum formation inhibitor Maf [Bacteroidota bacterium]